MSDAWSRYWARETSGACLPGAPPAIQAILRETWTGVARALADGDRVLDICAGAGAALRVLRANRDRLNLTGVDQANVGPDAASFGIRGGIDAHALPFDAAGFDAVISQFGLEYCGHPAWAEAVRVLKPGGMIRLICHHADSPAVQHNGRRLVAMRAMADAGLFALAEAVASGHGEDPAAAQVLLAAREAHGDQSVVSELPMALGHWARARRPDAVAAIRVEAEAEMARLSAMQGAALDAAAMAERLCWLLPLVVDAAPLVGPDGLPIGWVVRGNR